MKFKGTIWMTVAFVGIVLYYYLVDIPAEKKQSEENARAEKILLFESNQVENLILEKKNETFHLARKGPGDWELLKPVQAKADTHTVSSFLSLLQSARFSRVVENSSNDLSVYGLQEPSLKITLQLKEKGQKTLLVGDDHPINQYLYVKRVNDNRVLLASANRKDFDKSLFDIRDKSLLQFKDDEVKQIGFHSGGETFALSKQDEQWKIVDHDTTKADADEVKRFLRLVRNFKVKKFLHENPGNLKPYGLDAPSTQLTLQIGKTNEPLTLLVGNKLENEGFYGKTKGTNNVVLFGIELVEALIKKPVDFMPKTLLEFNQQNVSRIHLSNGEEKILLARIGENAWKIIKPIKADADLSTVNSLLFDLKSARIEEFMNTSIEKAELFGLDSAKKVLTVELGKDPSWTLELGNKSDDSKHYFGTRTAEALIFTISSDTTDKLFRSLHDLKNKKLLNFDKDAVHKISIEYPDKTFEMEKAGNDWNLEKPEKIKNIKAFLGNDIIWSLNGLEYESIVDPPLGDNDSGLSQPTVSVTVWTNKGPEGGRIIVGKKVEDKAGYYARVDGNSDLFRIKARLLESLPKEIERFKAQ